MRLFEANRVVRMIGEGKTQDEIAEIMGFDKAELDSYFKAPKKKVAKKKAVTKTDEDPLS